MKKVFAIFAIATLTACGGASTEATTDTTTTVDTAAVAADTTAQGGAVVAPVEGETAEKPATEAIK